MRITFKGNGIVWDSAKGKNLCKFKSVGYIDGIYQVGEYTTDDPREIEILKDYPTVPADAMEYYRAEQETKKSEAEKNTENLTEMSVAELRNYAKDNDISLHGKSTKADILEILTEG